MSENTDLEQVVSEDTEMKRWLVEYVGNKKQPENNEVTVEMVVETIAEEFPDFLAVVAEENWVRGYQQAINDVVDTQKDMYESSKETNE
jgi:hypothetical protein